MSAGNTIPRHAAPHQAAPHYRITGPPLSVTSRCFSRILYIWILWKSRESPYLSPAFLSSLPISKAPHHPFALLLSPYIGDIVANGVAAFGSTRCSKGESENKKKKHMYRHMHEIAHSHENKGESFANTYWIWYAEPIYRPICHIL